MSWAGEGGEQAGDSPQMEDFKCPQCNLDILITEIYATPVGNIIANHDRLHTISELGKKPHDPLLSAIYSGFHGDGAMDADPGIPPTISRVYPGMNAEEYAYRKEEVEFLLTTVELCQDCFLTVRAPAGAVGKSIHHSTSTASLPRVVSGKVVVVKETNFKNKDTEIVADEREAEESETDEIHEGEADLFSNLSFGGRVLPGRGSAQLLEDQDFYSKLTLAASKRTVQAMDVNRVQPGISVKGTMQGHTKKSHRCVRKHYFSPEAFTQLLVFYFNVGGIPRWHRRYQSVEFQQCWTLWLSHAWCASPPAHLTDTHLAKHSS
jgi:hypothetical protein